MAFLVILLVETLSIASLLIWVRLLTLRATGRIGPRRGRWGTRRIPEQERGEDHPPNQ